MKRCFSFPLPMLSIGLLVGCGGHSEGSSSCVLAFGGGGAAYVGDYTATFTPKGGLIGGSLDLTFSVDAVGAVTGAIDNPSTAPGNDARLSGGAGEASGCGEHSGVNLTYTLTSGGAEETLTAFHPSAETLAGTYSAERFSGNGSVAGTLTISKVTITPG